MNIIEQSQKLLARNYANGLKIGVLFLINAAAWFALDAVGVDDLTSPWVVLTLVPILLIYIGERRGKVHWFLGMTLPCLCVFVGMTAVGWALNSDPPLPDVATFAAVSEFILSLGFLLLRMWTFEPDQRRTS